MHSRGGSGSWEVSGTLFSEVRCPWCKLHFT